MTLSVAELARRMQRRSRRQSLKAHRKPTPGSDNSGPQPETEVDQFIKMREGDLAFQRAMHAAGYRPAPRRD